MLLSLLEPTPAPIWSLSALAAMEGGADTFGVLSLFFSEAAGGAKHYGVEDASDEDLEDSGSVLGRMASWPDLPHGFDLTAPRLGLPSYEFVVADDDGELEAVLVSEAALAGTLNVSAKIRVGTEGLSATLWPVWKTLALVDWMNAGENSLRLICRQLDGWLTKQICQSVIQRSEWPYARADAIGQVVAVPVGAFDSRGSGTAGAFACPYVDMRTNEWKFLAPGKGWYEVPRVYVDGVLADGPSAASPDYAITHTVLFDGYYWTMIEFTADPGDAAVVRCDLSGPDPYEGGTGAMVQDPIGELKFLVHRATGTDSGSVVGAYLDGKSTAEVSHYSQGFRRRAQGLVSPNQWRHGRRTNRIYQSHEVRVLDAMNDICQTIGVYPYWTAQGLVGFAVPDHREKRRHYTGLGSSFAWHWVRQEDLANGEVTQRPAFSRHRQRLECGFIAVKDPHVPNILEQQVASERIPTLWAREQLHEGELWPYATTQDSGFTETGGGTDPHDSIADQPYTPDTVYTSWAAGTGTFRVRARHSTDGPQIPTGPIALVEIRFKAKGSGTTAKGGVYIGSTAYYDTTVGAAGSITLTTTWTDYLAATFLVNPATTDNWLSEEINPDQVQLIVSATGAVDVRAVRAVVYRFDGGAGNTLVREALARGLALRSIPKPVTVAEVGMSRAAIRPGDPFSISTETVIGGDGEGWGVLDWQKRRHVLCRATLRLNDKTCVLEAVDAHSLTVPIWETGVSESLAPEARGVVRLGSWPAGKAGGPDGREFRRVTADDGDPTGEATITAPWGTSETIPADHEKYTDQGLLMALADVSGTPDLSPDILRAAWRHDYQCWPIHGGWAIFLANVQALDAGTVYTLFRFGSDVLHLDVDDDKVRFRRTVGGTDYDVEVDIGDAGISTGNLAVAIRWTPGEGGLVSLDADGNEQETPPYTLDLWTRQSTTTTQASPIVAVAGQPGEWLYEWSDAGAVQLAGAAKLIRAHHTLATDEEIEAALEVLTS